MSDRTRGLRDVFRGIQPPESVHPGLWIGKFLALQSSRAQRPDQKDPAREARDQLITDVEQKPLPAGYREAFDTWRAGFDPERSVAASARARGRVAVGLGAKGASEFGITLHHTWGVPVLPGSSLKGIAALGAREHLTGFAGRDNHAKARPGGPSAYDALFGDVEEQGAVVFHDAWFDPSPGAGNGRNGLHRDVLTVHHPGYYQQGTEPTDTESPVPVPFVSAAGSWLVALELAPGLDPATEGRWLEVAWAALRLGLDRHGIGSKTNAGYGRVSLPEFASTDAARVRLEQGARRAAEAEERRRTSEREASRARRSALTDPAARVADVLRVEGLNALRSWIETGGVVEVAGLTVDQGTVVAASRALFAGQQAKGLEAAAPAEWRPWVAEGLRAPPPVLAARRALREGELDTLVQRNTGGHGQRDYNKICQAALKWRLDTDGVRTVLEHLREIGAGAGHLKGLQADLEAAGRGD